LGGAIMLPLVQQEGVDVSYHSTGKQVAGAIRRGPLCWFMSQLQNSLLSSTGNNLPLAPIGALALAAHKTHVLPSLKHNTDSV
jgi:hypothetical protein